MIIFSVPYAADVPCFLRSMPQCGLSLIDLSAPLPGPERNSVRGPGAALSDRQPPSGRGRNASSALFNFQASFFPCVRFIIFSSACVYAPAHISFVLFPIFSIFFIFPLFIFRSPALLAMVPSRFSPQIPLPTFLPSRFRRLPFRRFYYFENNRNTKYS